MESVEGLFKTNDAGDNVTLSRWQGEIEHFGRNTVLTYQNMGKLATHEDIPEPLRAIAGFMNDAGDTLGVLTLGLAPGVENHGGLTGGIAAIATGDQFFYAVQTRTSTNSKNEFVLDDKPTLQEVDRPSEGKTVFTNGIQNSLQEAIRNGAMQTGSDDFVMAYNPEHGLLGDLLESFWDKNIGGVVASGNARQLTSFYQVGIDNNTNFNIAAHSQGTLLNYRAMEGLDFTNGGTKETGTVQFSGSPVDATQFQRLVENTGFAVLEKKDDGSTIMNYSKTVFQINRPVGETSLFGFDLVDSVADMVGGNYQYGEGGSLSGAIFSLPFLFTDISPHSNYVCQNSACPDTKSASVGEFQINLRTPNTDGKGYIIPKIIEFPIKKEPEEKAVQENTP